MEPKNTDDSTVLTTGTSVSDQPSWIASLLSQVRESWQSYRYPKTPMQVTAEPDPEGSQWLIAPPSALGSMVASIKGMIEDWRNPRAYTVQPAEVREIWGKRRYKTHVFSFVAYAAVVLAVYAVPQALKGASTGDETVIVVRMPDLVPKVVPTLPATQTPPEIKAEAGTEEAEGGSDPRRRAPAVAAPTQTPDVAGGGGGGGKNEPTPPTMGPAPDFADHQLSTPMPVPLNQNPEIAIAPTVVAANAPPVNWNRIPTAIGDPLGVANAPPSSGDGTGGGIGVGDGTGVGGGRGLGLGVGCCLGTGGGPGNSIPRDAGPSGPGGTGGPGGRGGPRSPGGQISAPVALFSPNPAYSDDGRKNKVVGQVVLEIVVTEDGSVDGVSLLRGLGHGLDESAIATVKTWRFRPGKENGKPVPVKVKLEVTFRLL